MLLSGSAGAAPTWLPPQTVAESNVNMSQVAVDPAGNAVAVWIKNDGTNYWVEASSRPVGGSWSAPEPLSFAGPEEFRCESCLEPQVAFDASGRATAIWSRYNATLATPKRQMGAKSRTAAGVWSFFGTTISTRLSPRHPRLAIAPSGAGAAVWSTFDNVHNVVDGRVRTAGGSWGFADDSISPRDVDAYGPDVAAGSDGTAVAVWHVGDGTPASSVVQAALRRPGDTGWSTPEPLSTAGGFSQTVAMNAAGTAVALWAQIDGSTTLLRSSVRPAGAASTWGASQPASPAEAGAARILDEKLTVDGAGNAVAAWLAADGSNTVVKTATRPAGTDSVWSAAEIVSRRGENSSSPDIAVNEAGDAVVVWTGGSLATRVVQAAVRPRGCVAVLAARFAAGRRDQ